MANAPVRNRMNRRGFLTVGTIGLGGLTLADVLRLQARADQKSYAAIAAKADSVIHIFLPGGIAHQETFDPKPFAPIEYRGDMGSIPTKIEGERFSETLPQTAQIADKLTVIRSMTHGEAAHERGTHNMFTGYRPSPALVYPSMGSVVSHEYGPKNNLPPYVCIPNQPNTYAGTGYLSSSFSPFSLGRDPADAGFQVQDLNLPGGINDSRFTTRRSVLDAVNDHFAEARKERQHRGDGYLLPAGLQPDQLAEGPRGVQHRRRARQGPRRIRPKRRRPADADGAAAGRRRGAIRHRRLRRVGHAHPDRRRHEGPDAAARSGVRRADPRSRPHRALEPHGRHGLERVRPDAQDQQGCRPRPLAQGFQRRAGRRRHQARIDLRPLERDGHRARARPDRPGRPRHHDLLTCSESSPTRS